MVEVWEKFSLDLGKLLHKKPEIHSRKLPAATNFCANFASSCSLDVTVPDEADCLVVNKLSCARPRETCVVLEKIGYLGDKLDIGSILIDRGEVAAELWEQSPYEEQYFYSLDIGAVGDCNLDGLIHSGLLHKYRMMMENVLDVPVEMEVYLDERPYVFAVDYHGPSEVAGKKPPFHFYLHFHELTGSVYVEKIELPKGLRNKGYGSELLAYLKRLCHLCGLGCIYLEAKRTAEGFWQRQDFEYLYRLNLRRQRRRERALRRKPGWERTWVGGYPLREPYWQYKNHPQDDLDFVCGLLVRERAWSQLGEIAV